MALSVTQLEFLMLPGNIGLSFGIRYPIEQRRYPGGYRRGVITGDPEGQYFFRLSLGLHRDSIPKAVFGNTGTGYNLGNLQPVDWNGLMVSSPSTNRAEQSSLYYIWGFHRRQMMAGNKTFLFRHIVPAFDSWSIEGNVGSAEGYAQRGTSDNQDIYSLQRLVVPCYFTDPEIQFTSTGLMRWTASLDFEQERGYTL